MADEDLGAEPLQALHGVASLRVGARDAIAHVEQDLGDPAHPHAADADEMDLLVFFEHRYDAPECCEMLSSTPVENMVMRSAEPPNEMNGRGNPLVGSAPVTTPMLTRVCVASITVRPSAR